ncbi:MAG TPA: CRISPR-associated endonuclease Cas2 [Candidatus Limiplasma sp.]|nr:CRISPR-associated endonuclease Cas2 [Candidatus Limiplasma sp.]
MMVLISYDVSTTTAEGRTRLRRVAKECQNHAQRVQASVFEADLDWAAFMQFKANLIAIISADQDSLRFYYLGNNWHKRIEHVGAKPSYNPEGVIIL